MNNKLLYKISQKNHLDHYYYKKSKLKKVGYIELWEHKLTKELAYSILPPEAKGWISLGKYPQFENL